MRVNKYGLDVANEIRDTGFISWTTFEKLNFQIKSSDILVKSTCIECTDIFTKKSKSFHKRTTGIKSICDKCILKVVTNSEIWRKKNSEAQLKIQSLPEQKLKNANAVSEFWKTHPETKEKVRQKLLNLNQDPSYKEKWAKNARDNNFSSLGGKYLFKNSWIVFDSSYELCFLIWAEKQSNIISIRRCEFSINYNYNERARSYWPDFVMIKKDFQKILVEVKSCLTPFFDKDKNDAKIKASMEFIKNNAIDEYLLIDETSIYSKEIEFKRSSYIRHTCKKLYHEGKLVLRNPKHIERYIGIKYENQKS